MEGVWGCKPWQWLWGREAVRFVCQSCPLQQVRQLACSVTITSPFSLSSFSTVFPLSLSGLFAASPHLSFPLLLAYNMLLLPLPLPLSLLPLPLAYNMLLLPLPLPLSLSSLSLWPITCFFSHSPSLSSLSLWPLTCFFSHSLSLWPITCCFSHSLSLSPPSGRYAVGSSHYLASPPEAAQALGKVVWITLYSLFPLPQEHFPHVISHCYSRTH